MEYPSGKGCIRFGPGRDLQEVLTVPGTAAGSTLEQSWLLFCFF
jgi:hypothetical protein